MAFTKIIGVGFIKRKRRQGENDDLGDEHPVKANRLNYILHEEYSQLPSGYIELTFLTNKTQKGIKFVCII